MIDISSKLTVYHDDNATFVDYTKEAGSYLRDSMTISMVSAEDYIYVGYEKPISAIYLDFDTAAASGTMTGEYYNGTAFTALADYDDDTLGLSRNAFVQWSRNQTAEAATTVNSIEMFWYRFKPSTDAAIVMAGVSIVFNDLQDLKNEYEDIDADAAETPTVNMFVNARNNILQQLRNKGDVKKDLTTALPEMIGPWDLLDIQEVKQAAIYFCMAKWFFNQSDSSEDVYADKAAYYNAQYEAAINLARLSLDTDDDGLTDSSEKQSVSGTRKWSR